MRTENLLGFISIVLLLTACGKEPHSPAFKSNGSPDFFRTTVDTVLPEDRNWERPTDCRANIEKALCEVDTPSSGNPLGRPCLGGEGQYKSSIEGIYDGMNEQNKKMFCSLRRIFIEKKFYATAYASNIWERQKDGPPILLPGAIVGIRKSILQSPPNLLFWISWKEQLNFAKIENEFEIPLVYPRYTSEKSLLLLQYLFSSRIWTFI